MKRRFHTTASPDAILTEGFRDGTGRYGFTVPLTGVFVARRPVDINEGATGDRVLEVTFPDDVDLDQYAIEEEGMPVWEWCVPAALINERATLRLLTQAEVDEVIERG